MLSVVIPAYNEEAHIARCLEALKRQGRSEDLEVILVNNGSTDRTETIARQNAGTLRFKVIQEPLKGIGAARAAGFQEAKGGIILSTDADTEVPERWVGMILQSFSDPRVAAVTGTCRIQDCSRWRNALFNGLQPRLMTLYRIVFGHYWLTGSNFAIRRDTYLRAGGFNPKIHLVEDLDLAFRVRKLGKIYFLRSAPVLTSGRRFKKGLLRGFGSYVVKFVRIFVFRAVAARFDKM